MRTVCRGNTNRLKQTQTGVKAGFPILSSRPFGLKHGAQRINVQHPSRRESTTGPSIEVADLARGSEGEPRKNQDERSDLIRNDRADCQPCCSASPKYLFPLYSPYSLSWPRMRGPCRRYLTTSLPAAHSSIPCRVPYRSQAWPPVSGHRPGSCVWSSACPCRSVQIAFRYGYPA
jgi:hypothetical protein